MKSHDRSAVHHGDHHIVGYIHETAGQISCIRCLQCGIGKSFSCAMGRDEIFQHGEPFPEIRGDGRLDDLTGASGQFFLRLGHKASHACELTDLLTASPGSGIRHHVNRIESIHAVLQIIKEMLRNLVRGPGPHIYYLVIPLPVRDHSLFIEHVNTVHFGIRPVDLFILGIRDDDIIYAYGDTGFHSIGESQLFKSVQKFHSPVVSAKFV